MAGQASSTDTDTGTRDLTLLFLLSMAVLWISPLMIGHEPWLDEGYGFSIIYNILLTGDPVVPTMAGLPFMEEPPLYYSLGALSASALSPWLPLHDGARLINTVFTAICLTAMVAAERLRLRFNAGMTRTSEAKACLHSSGRRLMKGRTS